jgi:hypothetical protein
MDMGIDEPDRHICPQIDDRPSPVTLAQSGNQTVRNGDPGRTDLTRDHVHEFSVFKHEIGGLVTTRNRNDTFNAHGFSEKGWSGN